MSARADEDGEDGAAASPPQGLVFRDAVAHPALATLVDEVGQALARTGLDAAGPTTMAHATELLVSAGALESALADADHPLAAAASAFTDRVALAWHTGRGLPADERERLSAWRGPERLRVSRPEGFAYYALSPRSFAQAAPAAAGAATHAVVVGVRTIGATLSAAVAASLSAAGRQVARFTVRPHGHPYDRAVTLTAADRAGVAAAARDGVFLVVDEGPGLSGSSFLSTAEALLDAGAPAGAVVMMVTRDVDPAALVTRDGAARWRRFRSVVVPGTAGPNPTHADRSWAGGAWRAHFWNDPGAWPAAWPAMERLKIARLPGGDGGPDVVLKYEGLGAYGRRVHARSVALARAGWGPLPLGPPDHAGFVPYRFHPGRPVPAGAAVDGVWSVLGRYLAARADLCGHDRGSLVPDELEVVARANARLVLGADLPDGFSLPVATPVIADGRMDPQEWLTGTGGPGLLKTDGASHGDDHFYPGPTDIAWDLAGALVTWQADERGRQALLAAYRTGAGEDPTDRLPAYELAYATFRAAYAGMAAHGSPSDDAARWRAVQAQARRAAAAALLRLPRC